MDKNKVIESAAKLIAKGQLEKAVKEFQRVLDVDPDDVRILQKLAELYQKMQRREEAADCFEKVAKTYAAQGFYLKAVALYKQVLKVVDRIEVNVRLAELYQQLGLVGDATKEWQNVAAYYEKVGDLKSSLDTLKKLVDLDPDNVAARIRLGEQYARQDNLVEAVAELRRAAAYLQRNGRQDDYIRVAERISHLDQGDVALARELAENYLSRGDSKRALAKLQICFKANPRDLQTLQMLARAFQELGQVSKTVSVLKELARVHIDAGRNDDARRVYQQALGLAPDDSEMKSSLKALEEQAAAPAPQPAAAPAAQTRPPTAPVQVQRPPTGPVSRSPPGPVSGPIAGAPPRPPTGPINRTGPVLPPAPARAAPNSPPPLGPLPGASIAPSRSEAPSGPVSVPKLLKETEVYVKYGLHEKALEHLRKIFAVDPENVDAHEKSKTLALNMNRPADAAASLGMLVRLYVARSDPRAAAAKAELLQIDPGNAALQAGAAPAEVDEVDEVEEVQKARDEAEAEVDATLADARPGSPPPEQDEVEVVDEVVEEEAWAGEIAPEQAAADGAAGEEESKAAASTEEEEPVEVAAEEPSQESGDEDGDGAAVAARAAAQAPGEDQVEEVVGEEEEVDAELAAPYDDAIVEEPEQEFGASTDGYGPVPKTAPMATPRAAAPVAPPPAEEDAFASDLAEVEFYVQAGLADDAKAILEAILLAEPGHAEATRKLIELGGEPAPVSAPAPAGNFAADDDQTMHDARPLQPPPPSLPPESRGQTGEHEALAAELAAELASEVAGLGAAGDPDVPLDTGPLDDFQIPAREVIGEFRAKLQQIVRPEDAQTHYDLGIAYKEMGLLDEAEAEFELALKFGDGVRKVDCISMLGVCAMERGKPEEAVAVLQRGLALPEVPGSARRALGYELGQAYEAIHESVLALEQYQSVERVEPNFRDVRERILRLGGRISEPIKRSTGPIAKRTPVPPSAPSAPPPAPPGARAEVAQQQATRPPPPPPPSDPVLPAAPPSTAARPPAASADGSTQPAAEPTAEQRRNRKIGFV